jgi:D-3-phosphoglycerate dehydrogenase
MTRTLPQLAVLVDYDAALFTPPPWIAPRLAAHGIEWRSRRCTSEEEVVEAARDADVTLIQTIQPITACVISQLERSRCIVKLAVGYDSVDLAAATALGIPVCNAPGYCTDDVAEHAWALLLDGARHIGAQDRAMREARWDRFAAQPGKLLRGSTLGLVAFGRIGRATAERARGFGMTVLAYDPYVGASVMAPYSAHKVELDELLRRSDFISLHPPLTHETYHMLGRREFALMKDGVVIANTSRGPVIEEAALVEALETGKVWAAGLDVMEQEPLPSDSPLHRFANVTLTPHTGASGVSCENLYRIGCEIVEEVCAGRWPSHVVNPEVRSQKTRDVAKGAKGA